MMREGLSAWIKQRHKGQLILQTDRPYFDHLVFIAELSGAVMPLGYEIGLCHDLLEETAVTGISCTKNCRTLVIVTQMRVISPAV
jgi:hypothetical protein